MILELTPAALNDLLHKYPGQHYRKALRNSGLRLPQVEALTQELYGMSFEEKRKEIYKSDQQSKTTTHYSGTYISRLTTNRRYDGARNLRY